jgi:hypothetical protein
VLPGRLPAGQPLLRLYRQRDGGLQQDHADVSASGRPLLSRASGAAALVAALAAGSGANAQQSAKPKSAAPAATAAPVPAAAPPKAAQPAKPAAAAAPAKPDRTLRRPAPKAPPRTVVNPRIEDDARVLAFRKFPDVGFVRGAPGYPPEPFHTDRAALRVPAGANVQSLLRVAGLELLEPLPAGKAPAARAYGGKQAAVKPGTKQVAPLSDYLLVKIPSKLTRLGISESAAAARFGRWVEFDSERAAHAMSFVLEVNTRLQEARLRGPEANAALLPDYLVRPAQLVMADNVRESGNPVTHPAADPYWRDMDLWRAWQLSQVAAPSTAQELWVAVVDQGFLQRPDMTWDHVRAADGAVGQPGDFTDVPWHGANCGSVLNAAVNDEAGAAGTALFGTGSNVRSLNQRPVKTLAVEMAAGTQGSFTAIAQGIRDAVELVPRAQIVSVSYAGHCGPVCQKKLNGTSGDQPFIDALQVAHENAALVVFAAGNDFTNLDQPGVYYVGCEVPGGLCVGGTSRSRTRWSNYEVTGTNYGAPIHVWGPAASVWVNGDDADRNLHGVSGTSMAAPFVAGALALVQSAWGETRDLTYWKTTLAIPPGAPGSVVTAAYDDDLQPGILDVYALLRKDVKVAKDVTEPPVEAGPTCSRAAREPTPDQLFTLHTETDRDCFPVDVPSNGCESVKVRVDYLRDDALGALKVRFHPPAGGTPAVLVGEDPRVGTQTLTATVCAPAPGGGPASDHYLEVYQEAASPKPGLTTGYSIRLDRGAGDEVQPLESDPVFETPPANVPQQCRPRQNACRRTRR